MRSVEITEGTSKCGIGKVRRLDAEKIDQKPGNDRRGQLSSLHHQRRHGDGVEQMGLRHEAGNDRLARGPTENLERRRDDIEQVDVPHLDRDR